MRQGSGDLQKKKYISKTIHRTEVADHFLETPEYEQFKYPGSVYLKLIKFIHQINLKNKFCRSVDPATFTPALTKIPGSAPVNVSSVNHLYGFQFEFGKLPCKSFFLQLNQKQIKDGLQKYQNQISDMIYTQTELQHLGHTE